MSIKTGGQKICWLATQDDDHVFLGSVVASKGARLKNLFPLRRKTESDLHLQR